jgi:hypothetical protein
LAKIQARTKTELVLGAMVIPRKLFQPSWERQKCSQEQFWYSWEHLTSVYLMGVSHGHGSHRRASHRRASHRRASHRRKSHRHTSLTRPSASIHAERCLLRQWDDGLTPSRGVRCLVAACSEAKMSPRVSQKAQRNATRRTAHSNTATEYLSTPTI